LRTGPTIRSIEITSGLIFTAGRSKHVRRRHRGAKNMRKDIVMPTDKSDQAEQQIKG